jgi:hypothetical protein
MAPPDLLTNGYQNLSILVIFVTALRVFIVELINSENFQEVQTQNPY